MRRGVRVVLLLDAAAIAAAVAVVVLAAGLPLAARGRLDARAVAAVAVAAAAVAFALGAVLLVRAVARPVERLLGAAERLRGEAGLALLGDDAGGAGLGRAAVAFERLATALSEERSRLAAQVDALERARASLVRAERLATVGRLAAGVAHEIGNPLGAIAGYADLARGRVASGAPAPELDDFLARIAAETRRIDRIVRDLLDFARPAAPALGPVSISDALDDALRLARVQARFKAVAVELAIPEDLPAVRADRHRLAQVLLNVLLNAGDAMGGGGSVRVAARTSGATVEVDVADDGPGIPAADLARVFDPFFTTKPPGHGTGLGLAVCHGLMESFGGDISAENAPAGGAVLRLRFRAASSAVPAA